MSGFVILSRGTSTGWSGPIFMKEESDGFRIGECYMQDQASIVTHDRFERLVSDRRIPENAEFVPSINQSVTCSSCGWVGSLNESCDIVDVEEDELIYSVPICPECEAILEI